MTDFAAFAVKRIDPKRYLLHKSLIKSEYSMRYVWALGKMPEVIDQGHGVHDSVVNQILVYEASRKESQMNSESLGQYYFGQPKTERTNDIVATNNHQVQSNSRCAKGVCEVAWKPTQATAQAEQPTVKAASISE